MRETIKRVKEARKLRAEIKKLTSKLENIKAGIEADVDRYGEFEVDGSRVSVSEVNRPYFDKKRFGEKYPNLLEEYTGIKRHTQLNF